MNILYINHYAGTPSYGMEYRPFYLAREWVRAGHRVQVVAASFSHVRSRQPVLGGRFAHETVEGVDFTWCATPAYRGNGAGRVVNIVAFLRRLGQWRAWLKNKPDVVIASSTYPADFGPARRIARRHGATLVWEVHDLWPLSPIELGGMPRWHPFIVWMQRCEDAACAGADRVVSMLPKVANHLQAHGLDLRKLHIVPNGIALDDWQAPSQPMREDVARALAEARQAGRAVVGYAGSMGLPNALDALLDAAALLRGEPLQFVLVGDGHEKLRLARRVADERLDHVTLLPPVPKSQIPALLEAIDIAYIGWQQVPIYRFGIAPNKLMDYMMAGVPVLHSVEAGNDPVADAGCGLTVAPESPQAIADGLRQLAALTPDARRAMGERGRAYVRSHHAWPVLARRFIEAVA